MEGGGPQKGRRGDRNPHHIRPPTNGVAGQREPNRPRFTFPFPAARGLPGIGGRAVGREEAVVGKLLRRGGPAQRGVQGPGGGRRQLGRRPGGRRRAALCPEGAPPPQPRRMLEGGPGRVGVGEGGAGGVVCDPQGEAGGRHERLGGPALPFPLPADGGGAEPKDLKERRARVGTPTDPWEWGIPSGQRPPPSPLSEGVGRGPALEAKGEGEVRAEEGVAGEEGAPEALRRGRRRRGEERRGGGRASSHRHGRGGGFSGKCILRLLKNKEVV